METAPPNSKYLTYPSPIIPTLDARSRGGGGIRSTFLREAKLHAASPDDSTLTIISGDREHYRDEARRIAVQPSEPIPPKQLADLQEIWYDEYWELFHPEAYKVACRDMPELIPEVCDPSNGSRGMFEEHFRRHGIGARKPMALNAFAESFDHALKIVKPGSHICWTDFYFADVIHRHASRLRQDKVKQTYQAHMTIPEGLDRSPDGQRILHAMALTDQICVHTDMYRRRIEEQISRFTENPRVVRFSIGPDTATLDEGIKLSQDGREEHAFKGFDLSSVQKAVIDDIAKTTNIVPHRFICLDRLDIIKGIHVVTEAIDRFLASRDMDEQTLKQNFRFYFIAKYYEQPGPTTTETSIKRNYTNIVREKLRALVAKYPGIVMACDNVPIRNAIAILVKDTHVISGSIQEGMNLAVQEAAYVNSKFHLPRTVIIADGAGFAIQAKEDGHGDLAFFPRAGDVKSMFDSLNDVVDANPETLRAKTMSLVENVIKPCNAPLIAR